MIVARRVSFFAAAALIAVCGAIALAVASATVVAHGKSTPVRSVNVDGQWYLSAPDVARALGGGASFDARTRTLYASAQRQPAGLPTETRVGGGWASDGYVQVRVVWLKTVPSFQGSAPDPGTHFVQVLVKLKNVWNKAVPLYNVETSMVKGPTHIGNGQFYDQAGNDVAVQDAPPGAVITYLDVFEIRDDTKPDAILVHPPFAPTSGPVDMLIRL